MSQPATQQPTITVQVKNIYGQQKIYPACEKAKAFASIAGTSTLTPHTIKLVKELGYTIAVQQEKVEL